MGTMTNLLTDTKAAIVVTGTSATTGTVTFLDLIPDDIGKLATMISMVLGLVLIVSHGIKMVREHRMGKIDFQLKERQLQDLDEKKRPHITPVI